MLHTFVEYNRILRLLQNLSHNIVTYLWYLLALFFQRLHWPVFLQARSALFGTVKGIKQPIGTASGAGFEPALHD